MTDAKQHTGATYSLVQHDYENGMGPVPAFEIVCGKCGAKGWAGNQKDRKLPPGVVVQLFRKKGWTVHQRFAKHHRCPECILHPEPYVKPEPVNLTESRRPEPEEMAINPSAKILDMARPLTMAQTVHATRLLDDNFNSGKGVYAEGFSDEVVAQKIGAPRASVAKLREEGGWGKIKEFSDVEKLRGDIGALADMAKDLMRRLDEISRKRLV
jgi:hypothetical protein